MATVDMKQKGFALIDLLAALALVGLVAAWVLVMVSAMSARETGITEIDNPISYDKVVNCLTQGGTFIVAPVGDYADVSCKIPAKTQYATSTIRYATTTYH